MDATYQIYIYGSTTAISFDIIAAEYFDSIIAAEYFDQTIAAEAA